jgi:hypothetical protein
MTRVLNVRDRTYKMLQEVRGKTGESYSQIVEDLIRKRLMSLKDRTSYSQELWESLFPDIQEIDELINARGAFRDGVDCVFVKCHEAHKECVKRDIMLRNSVVVGD